MVVMKNVPVTTLQLPGLGQDEPVVQVVEHMDALEPQWGHNTLCEHPWNQSQTKRENPILVCLSPKVNLRSLLCR